MLHIERWFSAYLLFLAVTAGAVGGSFINCLAWRTVHKEKITSGRSHCTTCGHVLGPLDLIPVFSWVMLGGTCRYCKKRISPRYLAVEVFMAVVSAGLLLRFEVSLEYLYYFGFFLILLAQGLVDLEIYEIPDRYQIAALLWWCLFLPAHMESMSGYLTDSILGGLLISGGLLGISLIFDRILGRESMGGGDIKLFFITGLYLGLAVNLLNVIISCFVGLFLAAILAVKKKKEQDLALIPFGPAIGISSLLCVMVGRQIVDWYMGFF